MALKGIGFSCNSTDKCTRVTEYPHPPPPPQTATLVAGHWTLNKGLDTDKLDTAHWTKNRTNDKGSDIDKLDIVHQTL